MLASHFTPDNFRAAQLPTAAIYIIAHPEVLSHVSLYSLHVHRHCHLHSVSLIHGMFSSSSRTAYIFETITGTYYWRIRGFGEVIVPYGARKMYFEPLAL